MKFLFAILAAIILEIPTAYADTSTPRMKLIFHIDSGPGSGVGAAGDDLTAKRISYFLRPLKAKYDVYVLLNPAVLNVDGLVKIMDQLQRSDQQFVLDLVTSDSWTTGSQLAEIARVYDTHHGISISMREVKSYKERYGKYFAGIRFHEILGADFSVEASRVPNNDWTKWYHEHYKLPKDSFFQVKIVEPFIKFARDEGMFIMWSDFHWLGNCPWDPLQKAREDKIIGLLRKYPRVITIAYANNEPNDDSVKRFGTWPSIVSGFRQYGSAGFGLSNQSWIHWDYNNTPIDEMLSWTKSAVDSGATMIQFEPPWYYFDMPQYLRKIEDYTRDPIWRNRGLPRQNYILMRDYLLKAD